MRTAALLPLLLLLSGCTAPAGLVPGAGTRSMVLATTTSVRDAGLLDALLPGFEAERGVAVKVVATGTGRALELGRAGDADVLLVHAPALERAYLANGSLVARYEFAWDTFYIVGPGADPAGVRGAANASDALARIAHSQARFVSRGDNSGTHIKERALWAEAGFDYARQVAIPGNAWYAATGQGMGPTLQVAAEQQAYTLTDDGTYWTLAPGLAVLRGNDSSLRNQYSVDLVNATRVRVQQDLAQALADYMTSPAVQRRIAAYEVKGHHIYTPDAGVAERG